jgi:predicted permease
MTYYLRLGVHYMSYSTVLNQVFILFAIMFTGFFARRKKIFLEDTNKHLSNLLLDITLPCTIVSSFIQDNSENVLQGAGQVFMISFFLHLGSILLGALLYRKLEANVKKVLWFITVFSNSGYMGYPIMESMYGKAGILYASIFSIHFTLFVWTFGYMLFSGDRNLKAIKNALTNSGLIAVVIGLILYFSPIKLPFAVSKPIDMLGSLTTPLSMLVIGSTLSEIKFREILSGYYIYIGTAVRLLLIPILTIIILKALGVSGIALGMGVVGAAMPAGATTVIFAEKFNCDSLLASRCVFFSTAVSIITIPITLLFI